MSFPRKLYSLLLALVSSFFLLAPGRAQEAGKPVVTDTPRPQSVRLNVLVTDASNRGVTDLRQEEFRVSEDGKPQAITYFLREELPVSYGLVVDASGSMRVILSHIIEAGRSIVSSNKPDDETFVLRFTDSENIQIEQGFTRNREALYEALDNIYVEGGLTALMDAVHRSVDFLKKYRRTSEGERRRQAIVLITDGEDRGSRARNQDALLNRLREEEVQFFIIGLSKMSALQGSREKAVAFLTRLAEVTGGRAFFPKSPEDFPGILEEITRDLHTQYVVGYNPTNMARDGSFRKIQVTVPDSPGRKKLNVIARPAYTAPR